MKWRVRADMSVTLEAFVEADSAEEAISKAQRLADSGLMREQENSGSVHGWEAWEEGA